TIFFATLVFSIPLGMVIALLRMNQRRIISVPVSLYILVMRGTPLMLQIFAIYFAIPMLTGTNLNRMTATILAFSLNYAAYFAEIFRGGIMAIPVGQHEACQVLGFTKMQTFFHVVLPQVVKRVLLPVSNEVITLVKDTSLSRIIALQEIIWAGQAFLKGTQGISGAIWPLFFTGIYYLIFSGLLTLALGKLEKKLDYFKA
ncbi:MAG: amino acid ABC transporter permease, partial [Oscillospiraceae bacterium]|nr:amino acid ABC transporter permease [Oscillospiraceae bacterium]